MNSKINVLGIEIDNCTAKEAMKRTVEYLESEPVNMIEMVTVERLLKMDSLPELKEDMDQFHLVLPGDKTILEVADITDRKRLQEIEGRVFVKMLMRYLHKNHKRVYLLIESEKEGQDFYDYLERYYGGQQIVGLAKISAENRADDMVVNAINGAEVDCVIAALSAPLQEDFIMKNKNLLNARVWIGIGKSTLEIEKAKPGTGRLMQFLTRLLFKKEIEKRKRTETESF